MRRRIAKMVPSLAACNRTDRISDAFIIETGPRKKKLSHKVNACSGIIATKLFNVMPFAVQLDSTIPLPEDFEPVFLYPNQILLVMLYI